MGERAKKKRAAEATASRKAKKTVKKQTQPVEGLASESTDPGPSSSDVKLPAKNFSGTATRVSSSTRRSTRSISSSTLGSNEKRTTSLKSQNVKGRTTHPQRAATAAARALLQQLRFTETEDSDFEEDPKGKSNDKTNMMMKVLILKIQMVCRMMRSMRLKLSNWMKMKMMQSVATRMMRAVTMGPTLNWLKMVSRR
jgi:hypothetical protein